MLEPRLIVAALGLVLGIAVALGVAGPLGTDEDLGLVARIAYWGLCAVVCWPICHAEDTLILYFTRSCRPTLIALTTTAGALFVAIPCTAVAYVLRGLFATGTDPAPTVGQTFVVAAVLLVPAFALVHYVACQRARLRASTGPAKRAEAACPSPAAAPPPPAPIAQVSDLQRGMVAAGSTVPASHPDRRDGGAAAPNDPDRTTAAPQAANRVAQGPVEQPRPPQAPAAAPAPDPLSTAQKRFLRSLPAPLTHDVVRLKADEHYVEVTTTGGSALILKRFTDAVDELGNLGIRVHRSHWVAHRHITRVVRDEHRTLLRLANGERIPVSRTYLGAVRNSLARRP